MRVEDRTGVMKPKDDKTPNVILICEDEIESQIVDQLGKPGDKVSGELHLADGYGEFYIRLEPQKKAEMTGIGYGVTCKSEQGVSCFYLTHEGIKVLDISEKQYELFRVLLNAWRTKERLVTVIKEVIELMDEEPAKEILKKAVKYE